MDIRSRVVANLRVVCARDCYDSCAMDVVVDGEGKIVGISGNRDNPITQGFLCPRGVADLTRMNSPRRVLYPYQRRGDKLEGKLGRASWDDAMDTLEDKLKCILRDFGPDSVLHLDYSGNVGLLTQYLPQRLFYALGAAETDQSVCSASGHAALKLHYGSSYGIDPSDLPNMKLVVYWGFNAAVSAPHLYALSQKARRNGCAIVAVDPRKSEIAKAADIWLQPHPGADVTLAYGVMKHLTDRHLIDSGFVGEHCYGFDRLAEETSKLTAKYIEERTGIAWSTIAELAELYATHRPSVTMIGIGMQKSLHGAESVRAVSLVPALVGMHRGFFYTNSGGWDVDIPYLTGQSLTRKKTRVVSQVALGKLLEKGEFKFVYIYGMNPAVTLPNGHSVMKGLRNNDVFVVVHDTHWTETARHANLVLPAATFLEKEDIVVSYSHRYVQKSNKATEQLGESRSELWIMTQIAKRLNLKDEWLYEDPWKAVEKSMKCAFEDGTTSDLRNGRTLKLRMMPSDHYDTPSGKIELYATKAEEKSVTPLPRQYPLPQSGGVILLNNATRNYTHTQFQEIYGPIPSVVMINPKDARQREITSGDLVELSNELGSIRLRATVSTEVLEGTIWSPRECRDVDGIPQNTITPDTTQKLGGGSTFNTTIVNLRKAEAAPSRVQREHELTH